MSIDIEKINTFETRNKVNKIKWRPIFGVIDEAYFKDSKFFSDDFMKEYKDNSNEARFIPPEMKNNIKQMAIEQGLHAQVIMLRRKDFNIFATDKIKNEAKFKFQGQSAISQRWIDLDFDWIEVNFSTHENDFYKKLFQRHDHTCWAIYFKQDMH